MELLKRFLSLLIVLLLLYPNFTWASNQLVASGTCTQANMRISAVNGGTTASGGAFVDFGAADVLTTKLGNLLVIKDSLGHTIQGWIKAAGSAEGLSAIELITDGDMETNPTVNWTGSNLTLAEEGGTVHGGSKALKGTRTGAAPNASQAITVVGSALYKGVAWGYHPSAGGASYTLRLDFVERLGVDVATKDSWADLSCYRTATGVTSPNFILKINGASDGNYGYFDDASLKQVLTPSATGVTITSLKGGSLYNWSAKDSAFNYNDASGYTYLIYKTPPVLIATGTSTAANTQLSLVDGTSFACLVGVDLTAYQTGKHLLAVYNSSTGLLIAMGYCSATPPAGETLASTGGPLGDGELLTNPTFDADTTGWTPTNCTIASVAGGQSNNCLELTRVGGNYQLAQQTIAMVAGTLFKLSCYVKSGTSGNELCITYCNSPTPATNMCTTNTSSSASWVNRVTYGTSLYTGADGAVRCQKQSATAGTMLFDEYSLKQVLDPPSTGLQIVNTKSGATQNWLYKGTGAVNEAITYKIYYVGD